MNVYKKIILPILSGLLLYAAWPMSPFTFLIFIAWVPLLMIEDRSDRPYRFFFILLLNLFIWNAATTWWIWNASEGGAAGAIIANSILMTIPWMLYRYTKRKLGDRMGQVALVMCWISWEYLHHNWDLSWPWLTLGNVFADHPGWVRWYAYTGTTGGTLWVWAVNLLVFNSLKAEGLRRRFAGMDVHVNRAFGALLCLLLPLGLSFVVALSSSPAGALMGEGTNKDNVVVVQPNIDPYKEKFSTDVALQIDKLIRLSESRIDTNTRMVVWPETAVALQAWEDQIATNPYYQPIFNFVRRHPKVLLVTGIDSYVNHGSNDPGGFSIRTDPSTGIHYEAFNTAMAVDSSAAFQLYHKSKLVPGVETLPEWLSFLGKWFEDFGGISGTLGRSKEPMVFGSGSDPFRPAPVICYESIYGEYVSRYIRKGANIITVITNDGWWGNTPGYHQHQNYARLRAIETGCWVVRSANTGISCFITPEGEVIDPQPWDTEAAIKLQVWPNEEKTFFVRYGDLISRTALVIAAIVLVWAIIASFLRRRKERS